MCLCCRVHALPQPAVRPSRQGRAPATCNVVPRNVLAGLPLTCSPRALLGGAHRLIGSLVSFVHWTTSSRSTLSTPAVSWLLPLAGPARAVLEGAILFVPVLAAMVGGQQTALACIAASLLLWICCMLVRYRPRGTARDGSAAQTQHRWRAALRAASAAGQQAVESACQPPQRCVRPFWPARKYVRVCYVRHKKGLLPNTGTSHPFGRG